VKLSHRHRINLNIELTNKIGQPMFLTGEVTLALSLAGLDKIKNKNALASR
jgi:hypothetical protein